MKYKILVPIDFGSQSIIALDYAKFYAKKIDAEFILLNVIEESGILRKFLSPELEEKMANQATMALKQLASEKLEGFDYKICVRVGKPYDMINTVAEENKPLMILMGKSEELSLKKRFLGSNTLHVIEETIFPVVSVSGQDPVYNLSDWIFLPMDLARPVKEQVSTAIEFAKIFNAKIYAFSVDVKDDAAYDTKLLVGMNQVKKTIEGAGIECKTEITEDKKSNVVTLINKKVEELQPMLTVIMVRDESRVDELSIGNTAHKIIETVKYPVLSEKPWDLKTEAHPLVKMIFDPMNVF